MSVERKIITSTVLLVLFVVVLIGFLIVPTVGTIEELTEEMASQHQEIERRYILRNYVKQTQDDIASAQSQLEKVRRTSIQEGEELQFIESLEHAASVSGVEQTINLETASEKELTLWEKEIPLKIGVSGPFPGVMSWLNEIEHLDYYILFDSMSISAQRTGGAPDKQGRVEAQFSGKVNWVSAEAPYFKDLHDLSSLDLQPARPEDNEEDKS